VPHVSVYASQVCLEEDIWQELAELIQTIPQSESIFMGRDFNGHIGAKNEGL